MEEDSDSASEYAPLSLPVMIRLYVEAGYSAKERNNPQEAEQFFRKAITAIDTTLSADEKSHREHPESTSEPAKRLLVQQRQRLQEELNTSHR